jgi:hypothetical protein
MAEKSAHEPPGLPKVEDEALDTPMWVPILGLSLLGALALLFVYQATVEEPTEATPSVEQAAPEAPEGAEPE